MPTTFPPTFPTTFPTTFPPTVGITRWPQPGEPFTGNITLLYNPQWCTLKTCDLSLANFSYLPTVPGNALFAAIFASFAFLQVFLGIKNKTWSFMTAMVLGLLLEIAGYVARVLIHDSPFNNTHFLVNLTTLTIAPAFFTAAIYLCLSRIVIIYGEGLSRFKPSTFTLVFCIGDFISLVLQAAGGAIASTANTRHNKNTGRYTMLAGLVFQVISLIIFGIAAADFAWRVKKSKGSWNPRHAALVQSTLFKSFLLGLLIACITIFIRSVYRCAELSNGFNSKLFESDEALFMILEGTMIIIATLCLTFLHPAVCFQGAWHDANFQYMPSRSGPGKLEALDGDDDESARMTMGENVHLGDYREYSSGGHLHGDEHEDSQGFIGARK